SRRERNRLCRRRAGRSDLPMKARITAREFRSQDVKYMLMMNAKRGKGDWEVIAWPPEDLKAHIGFVKRFNKELRDAGELVAAEGLAAPGQARVVGARKDGTPEVTDGPFQKPRNLSRDVRARLLR